MIDILIDILIRFAVIAVIVYPAYRFVRGSDLFS